jgi:hypothetical protein
VFRCTLQKYVGTAQLVWVSGQVRGRYDLALFDTPDSQLIDRHLSRDTVADVRDAHFATSTALFRAAKRQLRAGPGRTPGYAGTPTTRCAAVPCSPGSGPPTSRPRLKPAAPVGPDYDLAEIRHVPFGLTY